MSILLSTPGSQRAVINKLAVDASQNIAASTDASPAVLNVVGHGLKTGDVVAVYLHTTNTTLNGVRTAVVIDPDHLSTKDFITGAAVNGTGAGAGGATGKIQRLAIGLCPSDLEDLKTTLDRVAYNRVPDKNRTGEKTIRAIFGQ